MRKYHAMILGIETYIGQEIYHKLRNYGPSISLCVPAATYPEDVDIPSNIVILSLNDENRLAEAFSKYAHIVVLCSKKYQTIEVDAAARKSDTKLINAIENDSQIVIESFEKKMIFSISKMDAYQFASENILSGLWEVAHQKRSLSFPEKIGINEWAIRQDDYVANDKITKKYMTFKNMFYAYLFYFCAFILRLFCSFVKYDITFVSDSEWKFVGETFENKKKFNFVVETGKVNIDSLRVDLCFVKIVEELGLIKGIGDLPWFSGLNFELKKYEKANEKKNDKRKSKSPNK